VRTSRALHVFGVAALALALVDGGSVHARRAPPQPLSAAAVDQAACSDARIHPKSAILQQMPPIEVLDAWTKFIENCFLSCGLITDVATVAGFWTPNEREMKAPMLKD